MARSDVSRTQQQAQMTMFLVVFPSTIISGFMYPIANMPTWLQPITYAIPLRYFLIIIRSVMLKGSGLAELWPEVLALLCFAVGLVCAGSVAFRKRLQ
jgi:ABC-2 type transport system permease protein